MTLSQSVLSGLIQANINAIPGIVISQPTELSAFADAVAKAVVDHITNAAVVTVTGVTPGVGTANGTVS